MGSICVTERVLSRKVSCHGRCLVTEVPCHGSALSRKCLVTEVSCHGWVAYYSNSLAEQRPFAKSASLSAQSNFFSSLNAASI